MDADQQKEFSSRYQTVQQREFVVELRTVNEMISVYLRESAAT
jgi:hypothetical protein